MRKFKTKRDIFSEPGIFLFQAFLNNVLIHIKALSHLEDIEVIIDTASENCCTNGMKIFIGKHFPFFENVTIDEIINMSIGVLFHEMLHCILTPFSKMAKVFREVINGKLPDDDVSKKIKQLRSNQKQTLGSVVKYLDNAIEDGRIERIGLYKYSFFEGLINGLKAIRKKQLEGFAPEALTNEDTPACRLNSFINCALYTSKYGKCPVCISGYRELEPLILSLAKQTNTDYYCKDFKKLIVEIYEPFFEDIFNEDKTSEEEMEALGNSCSSMEDQPSFGTKARSEVETATKELKDSVAKTSPSELGDSPEDCTSEGGESSKGKELPEGEESSERTSKTSKKTSGTKGEEDTSLEDLVERMSKTYSKEYEDYEKAEEMKEFGKSIDYGEFTQHHEVKVIPPREIKAQSTIGAYKGAYSQAIAVGKNTAKRVKPFFNPEVVRGYQNNCYYGPKFHASKTWNPNLKHFEQKCTDPGCPSLSIAILIDESGSMGRANKIDATKNAVITLFEMCAALKIPFTVIGHTEAFNLPHDLQFRCYCSFDDEYSDETRRKLMSISARENNRDGAALRYASEILLTQQTDKHLLFVISDGMPEAYDYGYTVGKIDIQNVIQEYERQGITYVTAAIDGHIDSLKSMYGAERFIDARELDRIPEYLVSIIKRNMRRR